MSKQRILALLILLLAIVGVGVSGYLTDHHYKLLAGIAAKSSICSINQTFDCESVSRSSYAEAFGYPLSIFGMALYGVFAAWALLLGWASERLQRWAFLGILLVSGLAILADGYLFFLLAFRLKTYCLLCLATYALNLGVFISALLFSQEKGIRKFTQACSDVLFAGVGLREILFQAAVFALMFGLAIGANHYWKNNADRIRQEKIREWKEKLAGYWQSLPVVTEDLQLGESPNKGAASAPVTVVEFSDFQCPHCKLAAGDLKTLFEKNHNQLRIFFKSYPLDRSCNPAMKFELHKKACLFARAAFCAGRQQKFWPMHDLLFGEGEQIDETNLVKKAESMGLAPAEFLTCLGSDEARAAVDRDVALGNRMQVHSTPTLIVNQRKIEGLPHIEVFQFLIDLQVQEKK